MTADDATGADPITHKGWYSRGYLPHLDQPGILQSVSFRLHDSVPADVIARWKQEVRWRQGLPKDSPATKALRRRIAEHEDAGHGACWLAHDRIATLVEDTLLHFDGQRYRLIAWCIMPNHVHALIETQAGHPLSRVVSSWKSFTGRAANGVLGLTGPFWARDYYDRYIRDDRHLAQIIHYIEQNPVNAGLVVSAAAWGFGSAARRGEE